MKIIEAHSSFLYLLLWASPAEEGALTPFSLRREKREAEELEKKSREFGFALYICPENLQRAKRLIGLLTKAEHWHDRLLYLSLELKNFLLIKDSASHDNPRSINQLMGEQMIPFLERLLSKERGEAIEEVLNEFEEHKRTTAYEVRPLPPHYNAVATELQVLQLLY